MICYKMFDANQNHVYTEAIVYAVKKKTNFGIHKKLGTFTYVPTK